jgi:hypothetical protein
MAFIFFLQCIRVHHDRTAGTGRGSDEEQLREATVTEASNQMDTCGRLLQAYRGESAPIAGASCRVMGEGFVC